MSPYHLMDNGFVCAKQKERMHQSIFRTGIKKKVAVGWQIA
jgi:hypothetical protein